MPKVSKSLLQRLQFKSFDNEFFSYLTTRSMAYPNRNTLHFAHATGFNAQTYQSILEPLCKQFNVFALDQRGHGLSQVNADPQHLNCWSQYADDLLLFLESLTKPVVLVGHSMGGIVSMLVAAQKPDLVQALVLLEPTLVNPKSSTILGLIKKLKLADYLPIARNTRTRRVHFPSSQAAIDNYSRRGIFRTWRPEFIKYYVHGGTKKHPDGSVSLTCNPMWESRTYACLYHKSWQALSRIKCPVLILYGEHQSTVDQSSVKALNRYIPHARVKKIPDATHFLPMEYPKLVVDEINGFCQAYVGSGIDDMVANCKPTTQMTASHRVEDSVIV